MDEKAIAFYHSSKITKNHSFTIFSSLVSRPDKESRTTSMTWFWCLIVNFEHFFIVEFEQVNICWLELFWYVEHYNHYNHCSTWKVAANSCIYFAKLKLPCFHHLTLSWRKPISYRNQSIDLRFLYDIGLRHERVNWILEMLPDNIRS